MQGCKYGCNELGKVLYKGKWEDCPLHSIKKQRIIIEEKMPNGESVYDALLIPEHMRGKWVQDSDEVVDEMRERGILKYYTEKSVSSVRKVLEDIYIGLAIDGKNYKESVYIYPGQMDIDRWVYTVQRIGVEKGYSVVPMISVNDLHGLVELQGYPEIEIRKEEYEEVIQRLQHRNRVAAVGADWYIRTGKSYVEYLRAGVLFIKDTESSTVESLRVLKGVLEERGSRGLVTYVIGSQYVRDNRGGIIDEVGMESMRYKKLNLVQLGTKKFEGVENKSRGTGPTLVDYGI